MKKLSSILAVLLCTVMLIGMFSGCGKKTDTKSSSVDASAAESTSTDAEESTTEGGEAAGAPDYSDPTYISKEIIKPSFFFTSDGADGSEVVWQSIKKATNIEFKLIPVPLASFKDKIATTLASGDIPDIVGARDYKTVEKYGPQGAFLSLEPYIEQGLMPNFIRTLEEFPPAMQLDTMPDGVRYGAPRIYGGQRMDQAILVRLDVYERLGLNRSPETWDELYGIIEALKAEYPSSSPLINRWEVTHLLSAWASLRNTSYTFYQDMDIDDYVFGPDSEAYRETLVWLNKLYENNLLDKDFATMGSDEYNEALITNRGLITYDYQDTGFLEAAADLVEEGWDWGAILSPEYAPGKRKQYPTLQGYYGYTKVISAETKYPEELAKFFDWTYSKEGTDALFYGIEGETYEREADGSVKFLQDIRYPGNPEGSIMKHGLNSQDIFSLMPPEALDFYEKTKPREIAQYKYLEENNAFADPKFAARFSDESKEKQYSDIKTQVETYVSEQSTKVILGELDIAEWDKVVETCKTTYKTDEALALVQEAYKATYNK